MEFKTNFRNEKDLLITNASLSLGWFDITNKEITISFFKKGYCMVLLTLTSMLEYLASIKQQETIFQWVGEDNGAVIKLKKKGLKLFFLYNDIRLEFLFEDFRTEFLKHCKMLDEILKTTNLEIKNESAYKDFSLCLNNC